jgi:integrase
MDEIGTAKGKGGRVKGQKNRGHRGDGACYFEKSVGVWRVALLLNEIDPKTMKPKKFTGSSKSKSEALAKLAKARAERDSGLQVHTKNMKTGEWLEYWVEHLVKPHKAPRTYSGYRSHMENYLLPALGKIPLASLTTQDIDNMLDAILKRTKTKDGEVMNLAMGTRNSVLATIKTALNLAEQRDLVIKNRAKACSSTIVKSSRRAMTVDELKTITIALKGHPWEGRYLLSYLNGPRQGEALGLTWDRVDLEEAEVDISWQLQALSWEHNCGTDSQHPVCNKKRGFNCPKARIQNPEDRTIEILHGRLCLTKPKTWSSNRVIPIPPYIVEVLKKHKRATAWKPNPHNLVWHEEDGRPIDPSTDAAEWKAIQKRCGLENTYIGHEARHTAATMLMSLGVDVEVIKQIMGQANALTTQKYLHANNTMTRIAIDALAASLEA